MGTEKTAVVMKQLIVTIPEPMHQVFRVAAAKRGTSLAAILRPILEDSARILDDTGELPVVGDAGEPEERSV